MTVSLLDLRAEFCFASNSNPNERVLSPVLTEGAAEPSFETWRWSVLAVALRGVCCLWPGRDWNCRVEHKSIPCLGACLLAVLAWGAWYIASGNLGE